MVLAPTEGFVIPFTRLMPMSKAQSDERIVRNNFPEYLANYQLAQEKLSEDVDYAYDMPEIGYRATLSAVATEEEQTRWV